MNDFFLAPITLLHTVHDTGKLQKSSSHEKGFMAALLSMENPGK